MPIGTSEGEQHEDDTSFHLNQMNDQNDPFSWGMAEAMGTHGEKSDETVLSSEIPDNRTMESWKNSRERIERYNLDLPFEAPPGKKQDIGMKKEEPQDYKNWLNDQSKKLGRDVFQDTKDYDLESYYKDHKGEDMNAGHMTDKYKFPNHITFSSESKYHNTPEDIDSAVGMSPPDKKHEGGKWDKLQDGSWTFTPGRTNLEQHSTQELIDYFKKYEKGNHLLLPGN